jgi:hypothetical protein
VDENHIIGRMVAVLRSRPGEWMTFRYLASLVEIPQCDDQVVGALAEYRPDLFAIAKDRKLKLRVSVSEDIALQGPTKWQVPPPPVKPIKGIGSSHGHGAFGESDAACYCKLPDQEVLADLKEGSIPDEALVFSCCWKNICRVRGLFFNLVPAETWIEICRKRGYIQHRENPRGF